MFFLSNSLHCYLQFVVTKSPWCTPCLLYVIESAGSNCTRRGGISFSLNRRIILVQFFFRSLNPSTKPNWTFFMFLPWLYLSSNLGWSKEGNGLHRPIAGIWHNFPPFTFCLCPPHYLGKSHGHYHFHGFLSHLQFKKASCGWYLLHEKS